MSNADNVNLEQLLQIAITNAKSGNKQGARVMLQQILEADRSNDRAWAWLAVVTDDLAKRQEYLERALQINPNNKAAKKALKQITSKRSSGEQRTLWIGIVVIMLVLIVSTLLCLIVVASGALG